ncbi:MAG: bifunctional riboflavin kinase/FAD synthetase [Pseudomonadota bacterium]
MVKRAFAAIGNFDGVHRGHQFLLAETAKLAADHDARAGVVVFEPHPRRFFNPDEPAFRLTTDKERERLLRAYGVEEIFTLTFDAALAALSPEDFVRSILKDRLDLVGVVTGAEFVFGKARAGDAALLAELCASVGIVARSLEPIAQRDGEEKIGSSAVRAALRAGDVGAAARLLGRPWRVGGVVAEGRKLGRTIGFPTANVTLGDLIEPKFGVYAVRIDVGGDTYGGVANFGRRPTVGSDAPLLEAHLFDFAGDLYGKSVNVSFVDFIRDEKKFDSIDALKAQIAADAAAARDRLSRADAG